jgi:hypothetical protein
MFGGSCASINIIKNTTLEHHLVTSSVNTLIYIYASSTKFCIQLLLILYSNFTACFELLGHNNNCIQR